MKRLSILSLFLILTFMTVSCHKVQWGTDLERSAVYFLNFEFENKDGNALGRNLELSRWEPNNKPREEAAHGIIPRKTFHCDIILSRPSEYFDNVKYKTHYADGTERLADMCFAWRLDDAHCQIGYQFYLHLDLIEPQDILTYEIICPDIFGDKEKHVFTTYWRNHDYKVAESDKRTYPECYLVEYEGKEYTPRKNETWVDRIVTIRL